MLWICADFQDICTRFMDNNILSPYLRALFQASKKSCKLTRISDRHKNTLYTTSRTFKSNKEECVNRD